MTRGEPSTCASCGRPFVRYNPAHSYCSTSCRERAAYARNRDLEHRRRAFKRATMPEDRYAAKRAKEEAWKAAHPEQYRAAKRRCHLRANPPKWPVGLTIWYFFAGHWCAGMITDRPNNATIVVTLRGGTVIRTKGANVRKVRPLEATR